MWDCCPFSVRGVKKYVRTGVLLELENIHAQVTFRPVR